VAPSAPCYTGCEFFAIRIRQWGKEISRAIITTHLFQAGTTKTLLLHNMFRPNFWKQTWTWAPWIFKYGTNIADKSLKVLYSAFFANFRSFFRWPNWKILCRRPCMEGWSLRAEAPALSDFILLKNKKRIFRQLVLNYCKLLWPKSNQICSNLITFAQILPQIFPNFILVSHKSNQTCPNLNKFLQKK